MIKFPCQAFVFFVTVFFAAGFLATVFFSVVAFFLTGFFTAFFFAAASVFFALASATFFAFVSPSCFNLLILSFAFRCLIFASRFFLYMKSPLHDRIPELHFQYLMDGIRIKCSYLVPVDRCKLFKRPPTGQDFIPASMGYYRNGIFLVFAC